jgi:hypothetical protein
MEYISCSSHPVQKWCAATYSWDSGPKWGQFETCGSPEQASCSGLFLLQERTTVTASAGTAAQCHRPEHLQQRALRKVIYSITSSARISRDGGMVRPSVLAALMLMIRSNFVGCSIGRSDGLAPFKILST